jgi:ketosteroid isomerase-like protein
MQNKMNNEQQIRTLVEKWAAVVRNRNIDFILAHHSEDIVLYDVPPPFQSAGIEAYRKTWELFFEFTKAGIFDIQELHIMAGEEIAFCYGTMKCSDKSDSGDFVDLPFRLTIGLKKIADQWFIVHEHHSIPAG